MSSFLKIFPVALAFGMSPAAYAELESITDGELSGVTGQSGLTIDYSGRMSMQQFRYEDSGELVAEDIRSGGAGVTDAGLAAGYGENFDDARLTFDIAADGGLDILWQSQSGQSMDWGFVAGTVAVGDGAPGPRTRIFSDLQGWGQLRTAQHSVLPASESALNRSTIYNYAAFTTEALSSSKTSATIGMDGGYIKSPDYSGSGLDEMDLTDQIPAWDGGQRARSTTPMDDLRAGFAAVETSTYAVNAGEGAAVNDSLAIEVTGFAADVGAQNISVGQMDMGNVALDNIQISDTIVTLTP
jgi:uncharacterized protein DUF6160